MSRRASFQHLRTMPCQWMVLLVLFFAQVACARELYLPSLVSGSGVSLPSTDNKLAAGLTKEHVQRVANNNTIVITWANAHYIDFARNFVAHMRKLGIKNFMIGAMDREIMKYLQADNVETWYMGSVGMDEHSVKRDFGWGSANFHKMGRDKIRLIRDLAQLGVDALISDIDVVWIKDPFPFFAQHPEADLLVSTDQLRSSTEHGRKGLEVHICQTPSNIGIMWIRSTDGTKEMTQEWVDVITKNTKAWDQNAFNELKAKGNACGGQRDEETGLMKAYEEKVKMGVLPVALFSNGHTYYVQKLHERLPPDHDTAYAVHATFQYGGTPGKRHRMREALLWLGDQDDYFQHEGGFMSYTPHIPADIDMEQFRKLGWPSTDADHQTIPKGADPALQAHIRMVNYQLQQMYDALSVAWYLKRMLVMPPVLCGLDRVWFPHYGRFPGSDLIMPFECPLDHVLQIEPVSRRTNDHLPFKESSFLDNPRVASTLTSDSQMIIEVTGGPAAAPAFPEKPGYPVLRENAAAMQFDAGFAEKELDKLQGIKKPFLHFTSMDQVFEGFQDGALTKSFQSKYGAQHFGGEWCCHAKGNMRYTIAGKTTKSHRG